MGALRAPGKRTVTLCLRIAGRADATNFATYHHFLNRARWTARSMGSFLLMAGEPNGRAALPNASVLIHQPSGGFQGQASDILIHAEETLKIKQRMTRLYAEHCGRSYEEFEQGMDRDRFLTAEEALEWGIIDCILEVREEV